MNQSQSKSLERKTVNGVFWRYAEEITTKAVSFVVSVILARILIPENYSVVSIATIIIGCMDVFIDSGLSKAIIQKGNAEKEDYETVMAFGICTSFVAYLIIFFTAPLLSIIYGNEEITAIVRVLCLIIIVKSVKNVFSTNIRANLRFKKLFFSSIIGTVCSAVVGIVLAFRGYGAWALVAQHLTDAIIDTAVMRFSVHQRIIPHFYPKRFGKLYSYSSKFLISGIFARVSNLLSPAFISLRYSTLELAYYTKAKSLSGLMTSFIETPLSQVMFPVLSKIKDDREHLLDLLRKFYRALYFFTLPALLGLYVVADDFVLLLLTDKWSFIVPYMRIFIIASLFNKNIQGINAIGRSDLYLKVQIITRISGICFIVFAMICFDSPLSISWAFVPRAATYFFLQVYLEAKYLGYSVIDQIKDMLPSLIFSLIMAVSVYFIANTEIIYQLGVAARLAVKVIAGALIYALLGLIFRKTLFEGKKTD